MLKTDVRLFIQDIEAVRKATGYKKEHLVSGTAGDISARSANRMEYVRKAEREFIQEHQGEILELAAANMQRELDEVREVLTENSA